MCKNSYCFFVCIGTLTSQINYSQETLNKINEVESNISGNLLLNVERPSSITERMAKLKVKGLSFAVIHDFKMVWAKVNSPEIN